MAVRLDEKQAVVPSQASLVAVLSETSFLTPFREDIVKAQDADPEYAAIKDKLRRGEGPPPAERMLFKLVDDCLVVPESDGSVRLVVPTLELQQAICRHGHDESGHQGVQRTLHAITTFFYWPNMQRMIRSYVASCTVCQAAKPSNRLPAGVAEPISLMVEPGAHWTIDFMELPESANGFTRLLVFTDRVSKVAVLAPVRTATAVEVAEVFVQQVFCWFGMPQSFFSDKGPEFRSAVFHEICRMLGTTVKHSTSNTPHSHGDVERQNRIVNDVLRTMSQDQFPDLLAQWDEHVKLIQFTLNSAVVHRHGMSPLFFFFWATSPHPTHGRLAFVCC
jgi:transposase InsO family protein